MQEKSAIKARISQYLEHKGLTKYAFYKHSGVSRGILDQPTGITEENINRFLAYATDVSYSWLIAGVGEMLTDDRAQSPDAGLNVYPTAGGVQSGLVSDIKGAYGAGLPVNVIIPVLDMNDPLNIRKPSSMKKTITLPSVMLNGGNAYDCIIYRGRAQDPVLEDGNVLIGRAVDGADRTSVQTGAMVVIRTADKWFAGKVSSVSKKGIVLAQGAGEISIASGDISNLWIVELFIGRVTGGVLEDYTSKMSAMESEIAYIRNVLFEKLGK